MQIEELYHIFEQHPVITTDSRDCPEGSIFFALKGETFNGNQFAAAALEKGCAYAVVDEPEHADAADSRYILTDDVLITLQQLARHHRRTLGTRIIGVTGTNGKTTTKELIAAVLSEKYNVLYTRGNFNNHIGVPKTLLQLTRDHDIAVVEMGANHPGEICTLVNIVEPDCGIITNVGRAHLQGFGSFEGVVRTKGELYDYLRGRKDGFIFLNDNDPNLCAIAQGLNAFRYGTGEPGKGKIVSGNVLSCSPFLRYTWSDASGNSSDVQTHLVGQYNIDNVLCATAVGQHFGVSPADINEAISQYEPTNSRSQLLQTAHNTLIIDAYNANPTSMQAALENFHQLEAARKMVILGEMKELGESSAQEHLKILALLAHMNFTETWTVGSNFANVSFPFRNFESAEDVIQTLQAERPEGMTILIKGSNSVRLSTLVPYL